MYEDLLGNAPEWQERGLCQETDPEAFFPEKGGSTREAKRICNRCEVRAECLEYAMEHNELFGVWGGLSEPERRQRAGKVRRSSAKKTIPPELRARMHAMAAAGMSRVEIGRAVGKSADAVSALLRRPAKPTEKVATASIPGGGTA